MKWVEGKIVGLKEWAPGLYSLYIDAPVNPFVAGQFTQIKSDESSTLFRPYSFLNSPSEPLIEFYFTLVKQGQFSPFLAKLSENDKIWVAEKASGRFVLSEVPDAKVLWLFATGTGLGPFLSMLKTKPIWERFEHIVLTHSVRYANELTHQLLIETWQEQYPQFHWIPVVTREQSQHAFNQRLPALLSEGKIESHAKLTLTKDNSQVMLCGNPQMIAQMSQLLLARSLLVNQAKNKGHITFENYWK